MPHVRICAGGVGPPASLPRPGRSRPKDYQRAVVVDGRGSKETRKTTLRSEWRSALKKCLTGPTLLSRWEKRGRGGTEDETVKTP
jgi:hypothetical protein